MKIRRRAGKSSVTFAPPEADKSTDIAMGTNQAYESVQPHHHSTGSGECTQEEVMCDLPTV